MDTVPNYLDWAFIAVTFTAAALFRWVLLRGNSERGFKYTLIFLAGTVCWLSLQAGLAHFGVYTNHLDVLPPRIALLGLIPALLFVISLLTLSATKLFRDHLPLREMTLVHTLRVPVELVLYGLFVAGTIPEVITFAGRNFDILAGLSAPLIFWYGFRPRARKSLLIAWNVLGILLLLSVVIHALLAAPFPLQQIAFDQPNVAVLYFPYVWLPTYVVPLVLFCHLATLRKLFSQKP